MTRRTDEQMEFDFESSLAATDAAPDAESRATHAIVLNFPKRNAAGTLRPVQAPDAELIESIVQRVKFF